MSLTIDSNALADALDQTLPAVSVDPERPILSCVLVEAKDASLRLVATDSFRLAVRDVALGDAVREEFRALVPAASLRRMRPTLEHVANVHLGVRDGLFRLEGPGVEQTAAPVPAEFPAYAAFMQSDPAAHVATVPRDSLVAALEAATPQRHVRLALERDSLVVSALGARFTIECAYEGDGIEVVVNPTFAVYAAGMSVGPDLVVEVVDRAKPVVFRSADDGTFVCLLMPILAG